MEPIPPQWDHIQDHLIQGTSRASQTFFGRDSRRWGLPQMASLWWKVRKSQSKMDDEQGYLDLSKPPFGATHFRKTSESAAHDSKHRSETAICLHRYPLIREIGHPMDIRWMSYPQPSQPSPCLSPAFHGEVHPRKTLQNNVEELHILLTNIVSKMLETHD